LKELWKLKFIREKFGVKVSYIEVLCAGFRVLVCECEWDCAWVRNDLFGAEYMDLLCENYRNSLGELSWDSGIYKGTGLKGH